MQFDKITNEDLAQIKNLQPDGWSDITEEFRFYIHNGFCYPIKLMVEDKIIGVGASIVFEKTSWLAHIIVDHEYRNKGFGFQVVERLLTGLQEKSVDSVLLIATAMGEPVYKKAGFRAVSDYIFLKRATPWTEKLDTEKIVPYKDGYYAGIIRLDKDISGENREPLIKKYLANSFVYIDNKEIRGFYLPSLGEGQIFADTTEAGIGLMRIKYAKVDKAVIPFENQVGINFLKQNGFIETETKGKRMVLGRGVDWKPDKFFSRIGGNYG